MYNFFLKSIMTALFIYAMSNYATAQTYSGFGNGTVNSPYLITSTEELDEVRDFLGGGLFFRLENDIDLSPYLATGGPSGAWGTSGWLPIGDNTNRFGGNFDGNGKKITGLWIDRSTEDWVGLFGAIGGATAIIHNLGVEIDPNGIKGKKYVGGLVGGVYGNATLTGVYTTGTVTGFDYVGGLVGENISSTINSAYSTCNVNGINYYIGGLTGIAVITTISNVYATGNVSGNGKIGGLAGVIVDNSNVSNSYTAGIVHGNEFVGGLVGEVQNNSSIKNCVVASGSITAVNAAEINRISSGMLTGSTFSHNYCVGMVLNRASVDISGGIVDNLYDIQGEIKTLSDLHAFDFYNTPGNWDGGAWDIALDNSQTWNISDGLSFPFLNWQYAISASALTSFGSLDEGYATQPALQTVSITSEAINAVTLIQPASTNYEIGALSTNTLTANGEIATFTVRPKPGLTAGIYNETITILCNEGVSATVKVSFTVTTPPPTPPTPPYITGEAFMTLTEGYSATSTAAFTITGSTPVKVEKVSGTDLIIWNNSTKKLDIAEGLPVGTYSIKLSATNTASTYTFTFTLTVEKKYYFVDCRKFFGGSVTVLTDNDNPYLASEESTIMLTITPDDGYELDGIHVYMMNNSGIIVTSVVIPLNSTGHVHTFTMPAHHVSILATFKDPRSVGIEDIHANSLKAFAQNGILYVSGMAKGEMLSIYNITGTLIYQGIANKSEMEIHFSGRGVYIIRTNNNTVKVVN